MERKFSERERECPQSVADVISRTNGNIRRSAGEGIIFWGYTVVALLIAVFVLNKLFDDNAYVNCMWAVTIPLFTLHYLREAGRSKKQPVKNYFGDLTGGIWMAFFVSCCVFVCSAVYVSVVHDSSVAYALIIPAISGMLGVSLFIMGKLYKFNPFVYGAIVFWAGAIVATVLPVLTEERNIRLVVMAMCMIFGYIVPGHLAVRKSGNDD